jgi:hypothetical protein
MGRSWKAWHDYIKYKRFLKKATVAALKIDCEREMSLVKRVFDALR